MSAEIVEFPTERVATAERVRAYLLKQHSPYRPWAYAWGVRVLKGQPAKLAINIRTWWGNGSAGKFETADVEVYESEADEIERGEFAAVFDELLARAATVHVAAPFPVAIADVGPLDEKLAELRQAIRAFGEGGGVTMPTTIITAECE